MKDNNTNAYSSENKLLLSKEEEIFNDIHSKRLDKTEELVVTKIFKKFYKS